MGDVKGNVHGRPVALVVDDDGDCRALTVAALTDAGMACLEACDGASALAMLASHHIDLIVTDYEMPVMDGDRFARAVKTDPGLRHLPIVLVSGHTSAGSVSNIDAVITKPWIAKDLCKAVYGLLPRRAGVKADEHP